MFYMFNNITVFSLKDLFKHLRFFISIFICVFLLSVIYNKYTININSDLIFFNLIDENIPGIHLFYTSSDNTVFVPTRTILYSEIPVIKNIYLVNQNIVEDINDETLSTDSSSIIYAEENINTEVIPTNIAETHTNEFNGVEIKNTTDYSLTYDILNPETLVINSTNIIVFHTHTCESYTPSNTHQYEASGTFRTIDLENSVAKVGTELTNNLLSYGFNVVHDCTYHDYPSYSGSYGRSMATVSNLLISNPNTDIIIDIHRDAIADTTYNPSVRIGNDVVSQLMFVIGTDGSGLEHPNWQNNLKFAVMVQEKANELYPGLFRPILLRDSRYNQHLGNAACIIEVGATGNTLDESLLSMKYLAQVFDKLFN